MEREAFLYVKAKLLNSSIANRKNFGSGKVHFILTGTYMNDPSALPSSLGRVRHLIGLEIVFNWPIVGNTYPRHVDRQCLLPREGLP